MKITTTRTLIAFIALILLSFLAIYFFYPSDKDAKFTLTKEKIKDGLYPKYHFGIEKESKANPILRGLSSASATSKKEIISADYDRITELGENLFRVEKDRKYGIVDKDGNVLFEAIYSIDEEFIGEVVHVGIYNGYNALVDKKGKIVFELKDKSKMNNLMNGYFSFGGEKLGIIDEFGNVIVDDIYDTLTGDDDMADNPTPTRHSINRYFWLSLKYIRNENNPSKPIQEERHDFIAYTGNDTFLYFKDGSYSIINRKKKTLSDFNYDKASIVDDKYILLESSKDKSKSFKHEISLAKNLKDMITEADNFEEIRQLEALHRRR